MDEQDIYEHDFVFYSLLYSSITVLFAMAVLSKFLTNEFRFGFRSFLSLIILFIGEPMCHFLLKGPSGVVIFGLGCLFVYSILPASHLSSADKTVLITGCDSGFGLALAKKLDSGGMQVFAGCLFKDGPGAISLKNGCSNKMQILQLDVTKEDQIKEALTFVKGQVGEKGLWGLVNNAGIWYAAEVELTPDSIFRKVLDINLLGTIRMTKAFLPLIRQAKGRIVNMSSLAAKFPSESFGAYSVSKAGVEAYSDVLRLEMRKWDVKVSLVQPTGFFTV